MNTKSGDKCPYKEKGRNTQRRRYEDRGRDLSDVSPSKGLPRIAHSQQKLGEGHELDSPLERQRGLLLKERENSRISVSLVGLAKENTEL